MSTLSELISKIQTDYLSAISQPVLLIEALKELDNIVGMEALKNNVIKMVKTIIVKGKSDEDMYHSVITGPPGVGKTTVAMILCKIWIALGLIKRRQFPPEASIPLEKVTAHPLFRATSQALAASQSYSETMYERNVRYHAVFAILEEYVVEQRDYIKKQNERLSKKRRRYEYERRNYQLIDTIQDLEENLNHLDKELNAMKIAIDFKDLSPKDPITPTNSPISAASASLDSSPSPKSTAGLHYRRKIIEAPVPRSFNDSRIIPASATQTQPENKPSNRETVELRPNNPNLKILIPKRPLPIIRPKGSPPKLVTPIIVPPVSIPAVIITPPVVITPPSLPFRILNPHDLVAGYVGQTGPKCEQLLDSCKGCVVFIDEAYKLYDGHERGHGDFMGLALTMICEYMDKHRDEIIFIFAGYADKLRDTIFTVQPGLPRRCQWVFHIDKYTAEELYAIFRLKLNKTKLVLDQKLQKDDCKLVKEFFSLKEHVFVNAGGDIERLLFQCDKLAYAVVFDSKTTQPIITDKILKEAAGLIHSNNLQTYTATLHNKVNHTQTMFG